MIHYKEKFSGIAFVVTALLLAFAFATEVEAQVVLREGDYFEPSWWSLAVKPTNAAIYQTVDTKGVKNRFQTSNFSMMGVEAATHLSGFERLHLDLRFTFQRRVANSASVSVAVDEIHSGIFGRYSLYRVSSLDLSAGAGIEAFKLPYFSPLALGAQAAEFGFSSGLAASLVMKAAYELDSRSWASLVMTFGIPFRFDGDRSDEFKNPDGVGLRAAFEYKRMFSHVMFWDFALCFSFDQITYEQTYPFGAQDRLETFEQWGRLGIGARF